MEVYQGTRGRDPLEEVEEDIIELDLGAEDDEMIMKHLAIAVYNSRKSFNSQYLFSQMVSAWGIQNLASLKKIEDYTFKIVFHREEENARVVEGGGAGDIKVMH
jgi:hypothetical protein